MRNIFRTIGQDGVPALEVVGLSLSQVRDYRLSRGEMTRRAIFCCYLHFELGWRKSDVAFYTHKEPGTIGTSLKVHKKMWEECREEFLQKIKENTNETK